MAIRDDFTAGEVLAAADLNDTFASKPPFAYGTAEPSTTVEGFIWYDENDTPPTAKFWDGSSFENIAAPVTAPGLIELNTTIFSAVSTISVNDVFTATYDNYRIIVMHVGSTGNNMSMRLRAAGSDNSTASSYVRQGIYGASSSASAEASTTTLWLVGAGNANRAGLSIDLFSPALATTTAVLCMSGRSDLLGIIGGYHTETTSYDGFTLFPSSGTFTGTVSVYGYKKS